MNMDSIESSKLIIDSSKSSQTKSEPQFKLKLPPPLPPRNENQETTSFHELSKQFTKSKENITYDETFNFTIKEFDGKVGFS
jgi:hypothetical protein